ncbi:GNAT family N-acetyltransferase [Pullulanibacillus sp. KACC 23026]|uniref:GNAT family N-acetyltransferase n=1 Tax=Pullulanibacillus sp. KACC 23026 TaxID=3028315 RepID=UPI0023B0801A|nr:GNAT family N-acetyltransferase [Pullulanibacillus sp. KACC 23026]WEG14398.1 GNAT family N-acetyltransferase [Pullulanibacillus sp. KACC 23026]
MIRKATHKDIPDLVHLMEELGYPTTLEKMEARYKAISEKDNYHLLIAEEDGKAVGMAGLYSALFFEYDGLYVRLAAFVVDSRYRRKGIGKALLSEVEKWAKDQGAESVLLNSGNRPERKAAHQFYLRLGYLAKSIGFVKSI